jgi:TonB family protein
MAELIIYPAEVSVCKLLFYSLYVLALKNETHFNFNRFYLLTSILVSLFIPLLSIPVYSSNTGTTFLVLMKTVQVGTETISVAENGISYIDILVIIYLIVALLLTAKFIRSIASVYALRRYCTIRQINGLHIALCNNKIAPFSFFNTIFMHNESNSDAQPDEIMMHETIHIRQFHSFDIIFAEIVSIFTWFNPVSWLIKAALKETHEYLADSGVSAQTSDVSGYFLLLARNVTGLQPDIVNNLNKSLILKRLNMMKKTRSGRLTLLKALPVIPLVFLLFFVFSCKNSANEPNPQNLSATETSENVVAIADKMPEYKGGQEAMMKYIIENVKYPEEAKKNGIQGKVFVSFTVTKTGKLDNVKVVKTANDMLNAEALRVITSMPDWIPGLTKGAPVDVEITLPIMFKLS